MDAGDQPKPKKANPLTDLIDTEKAYVEQLTGIIRVRPCRLAAQHFLTYPPESRSCMVALEPPAARVGLDVPVHRVYLQDEPLTAHGANVCYPSHMHR